MRKKITLLFAAALSLTNLNAQTVLNESFTSPWNPNTLGWVRSNVSTPATANLWTQGNAANFNALSGGPSDFSGVGFNSTTGANTISNWLVTPTLNLTNGATLKFATRTVPSTTVYPDRMQIRSSIGTSTAVGTGTTSVGTFTNLLLDINPLYSISTATAVSNGTVNGYPDQWTVYSVVLSGITGTMQGRLAFRYFVENAGPTGSNSDYIGIDDVTYSLPCSATVASYTTCPSISSTLTALNGLSGTTYTWSPGSSTLSAIVVSPVVTTVYTLSSMDGTLVCPAKTATITIGANLSVNITASSSTICAGSSAILTANASATTFSWNTGATSQVIAVTPSVTTTYTAAALSGVCFGGSTIIINVNAAPTISFSASSGPTICTTNSTPLTLTATGGVSYVWTSPNSTVTTNVVSVNTPTAAGNFILSVIGAGANGCTSTYTAPLVIVICTGIENNNIQNTAIAVYPNPFTSEVTISGANGPIEVINTLGQVVLTATVSEKETINTTSLAKGIYFIKVKDADTKSTKTIKVIKD